MARCGQSGSQYPRPAPCHTLYPQASASLHCLPWGAGKGAGGRAVGWRSPATQREAQTRMVGEAGGPCGVFLPVKCLPSSTAFLQAQTALRLSRAVVGQRETGPAVGFGKIIFHIRALVFLFFSANRSLIKDGFTNCASWSLRVFREVPWVNHKSSTHLGCHMRFYCLKIFKVC